jgi:hypothetical protein
MRASSSAKAEVFAIQSARCSPRISTSYRCPNFRRIISTNRMRLLRARVKGTRKLAARISIIITVKSKATAVDIIADGRKVSVHIIQAETGIAARDGRTRYS